MSIVALILILGLFVYVLMGLVSSNEAQEDVADTEPIENSLIVETSSADGQFDMKLDSPDLSRQVQWEYNPQVIVEPRRSLDDSQLPSYWRSGLPIYVYLLPDDHPTKSMWLNVTKRLRNNSKESK